MTRIAVTGTPGTGKTTATDLLEDGEIIHLNDVIRERNFYTGTDTERDSVVADLDRIADWLDERESERTVVESHLAHHFDADRIVVLRCRPDELERRLRERGASDAKTRENREAEALDVILAEAVERHGEEHVYEIDTTGREPTTIACDIEHVIAGEHGPSVGEVDFTDYL